MPLPSEVLGTSRPKRAQVTPFDQLKSACQKPITGGTPHGILALLSHTHTHTHTWEEMIQTVYTGGRDGTSGIIYNFAWWSRYAKICCFPICILTKYQSFCKIAASKTRVLDNYSSAGFLVRAGSELRGPCPSADLTIVILGPSGAGLGSTLGACRQLLPI